MIDRLRRTARRCQAVVATSASVSLLTACAVSGRPAPPPEFGAYALGMTRAEAIEAAGGASNVGTQWPEWPPTSLGVPPPPGIARMQLRFAGDCVAAIEAVADGHCEDGLVDKLAGRYGAPPMSADGTWRWTDGTREVLLETQPHVAATAPRCSVHYGLVTRGLATGTPSTAQGIAACKAMAARHRTRFAPGVLHGLQRHTLDAAAALLRTN